MAQFTLDDVRRLIRACAGESGAELDGDIAQITFEELGYDSLAVLEMAAKVQQEYGIPMPDEAVEQMRTPQEAVDYISGRLATA
ncbi:MULTISPECIES: acyl carrier protein [Thermomonospora]|uniref:Act minimal PKS acyl carrier protein n=1 Tax=Thermomonospora cellulosilytica TaxID=1411118 RepID=A0A7W3RAA6_9ACTN|nr:MULTISPECIES: acyl carrier protein [Thermomonospora]MBA9005519.1 act minimal PKS acyl carrier protein [Thermomonospora cellulosilytica]